ncbi:MAG: arylsulfatase [Kiritimatiellales bacterium]
MNSIISSSLIAATAVSAGAENVQLPNIILILADDLGWGELGCYGQQKIKTPHLDAMAAEGMRFTQFYSSAPVCAPARYMLLTGKHAGHSYIRNNKKMDMPERRLANGALLYPGQLPMPADDITIAEMLKDAGYATACFGKWGLGVAGTSGDPLKQGFDRFYGYSCQAHAHNLYPAYLDRDGVPQLLDGTQYAPQLIADEMLQFIREKRNAPFFLYYATVLPHLALQVPEEYIKPYLDKWEEIPYTGQSYQPHPTPRACYATMISFMDRQVGRIFAQLKELNLDENTIVIFTSDNGTTFLGEQVDYTFFNSVGPLRGLKGDTFEGGVRIPFIARWPQKISAGTVSDFVGIQYDLMPTFAELTGVSVPPAADGISILPEMLGEPQQKTHDFLLWDYPGYSGQVAVRMGDWKLVKELILYQPDLPARLYNLKTDISESNDIAVQHPDIVAQMEEIILRERRKPEVESFRFGTYRD